MTDYHKYMDPCNMLESWNLSQTYGSEKDNVQSKVYRKRKITDVSGFCVEVFFATVTFLNCIRLHLWYLMELDHKMNCITMNCITGCLQFMVIKGVYKFDTVVVGILKWPYGRTELCVKPLGVMSVIQLKISYSS